jgi:hypothetical protein
MTLFTTEKMAVLAPIANAIARTATAVRLGRFSNIRRE